MESNEMETLAIISKLANELMALTERIPDMTIEEINQFILAIAKSRIRKQDW